MAARWSFTLAALLVIAESAPAQLPPESELPRSHAASPVELPSESSLPGPTSGGAAAQAEPVAAQLPPEGALPADAPDNVPPPAGPLPLEGSPDGIPWLRLNMRGHTAPIRAAAFTASGTRLCTAGDDKSVVVWSRDEAPGAPWRYERTIRWQIQRGTRGRVYALAAAPGLLAIAGEGAMGGVGEIVLVDPASGDFVATLFDEENGHRQVVVALDFVQTPGGPVLASHSMDGRTLLWAKNEQGLWRAQVVTPDDRAAGVAPEVRRRLLAARTFSAVVALDAQRAIVPVFRDEQNGRVRWRLELFDVARGRRTRLGGVAAPDHLNTVTAMATDADRTKLVSGDGAGVVYLWDLRRPERQAARVTLSPGSTALSLAMSPDGTTLTAGTTASSRGGGAAIEVWSLADGAQARRQAVYPADHPLLACAVAPGAGEFAYGDGASVVLRRLAGGPEQPLRGRAETPLRVAFPREQPYYRIGIGVAQGAGGGARLNRVFDTDRLELTRTPAQDDRDWLPANWGGGAWSVIAYRDQQNRPAWALQVGGARRARLPLAEERTGAPRAVCWVPGADLRRPPLAAIGTSSGGIWLVRVANEGVTPIVRQFRGHSSDVVSLAVSRDLRWLVSGSADATVRVWPLGGAVRASAPENKWGATFDVDDAGRLVIASIREDGPLHFRSAREGDEVVSCTWVRDGERIVVDDPEELRAALADAPWDALTEFELRTGRQQPRRFQMLPAWQQLASLAADAHGEWAFWAPSGYYDASFEGHRLFGWQVNRGLERLPDFFLAAQLRGALERPDVMSRLLRVGSVESAFRAARAEAPADSSQAIANAYRLKPEVTILSPTGEAQLTGQPGGDVLRARVRAPAGLSLVAPKAFANGVAAPPGRVVQRRAEGDDETLTYEWRLAVPSDPRVLVQVVASSEQEITATDSLVLENAATEPPGKPRLFLLAVGIDKYRDAQIPSLTTPVEHAAALTDLVRARSRGLYEVTATSLTNNRATRPAWRFVTADSAEQLRNDASPDDLLVIYLSGHGVEDAAGEGYHFVTSDADYTEVMAGGYADCLGIEDLAAFADIPCRKLVILDTCHGGAIQPMRHREMKAAVRALQQDLLLTLAASGGREEAVEGRFSARLLEALAGAADQSGDRDGVVRLNEVVAYVETTIADDSLQDAHVQSPSAGPADLLPFATPPLTVAAPSVRVSRAP